MEKNYTSATYHVLELLKENYDAETILDWIIETQDSKDTYHTLIEIIKDDSIHFEPFSEEELNEL